MNYNFYADLNDKIDVLNFIFNQTDLKIYDSNSTLGQEICEYHSSAEIAEKFDLIYGNKFAVTFCLYSPRHKGKPIFRRIDLDPKHTKGPKFRYSTDGWGLIQLYFGGIQENILNHSHIGHFNEKGALNNEATIPSNGQVDQWDWREIQKTSRLLKNEIHNKMAVRKMSSLGVLAGAATLADQGIELR